MMTMIIMIMTITEMMTMMITMTMKIMMITMMTKIMMMTMMITAALPGPAGDQAAVDLRPWIVSRYVV